MWKCQFIALGVWAWNWMSTKSVLVRMCDLEEEIYNMTNINKLYNILYNDFEIYLNLNYFILYILLDKRFFTRCAICQQNVHKAKCRRIWCDDIWYIILTADTTKITQWWHLKNNMNIIYIYLLIIFNIIFIYFFKTF